MLSSWALSALLLLSVDISTAQLFSRVSSSCSATGQTSCHNTTVQTNLCCFESPGGLLLQTQFWDTSGPGINLPTSWTVHGLWPDHCDGTFSENCDPSRDYTGLATIIQNAGQTELLNFMNTFWVDINGQNEQFWEHEWSTHGTCYSTLQLQCLPAGSPTGTEAVDFFLTVERLFKSLPTFNWLAQGGITPSSTRTFTLSELTGALKNASGVTPALNCAGSAINQISWYFNLQGSVIDGTFIPIDAPQPGTCASSGLTYPPKPGGSSTSSIAPTSPSSIASTSPSSIASTSPSSIASTSPSSIASTSPSSIASSNPSTSTVAVPTGVPGTVPSKSHLAALLSGGTSQGGVLTSGTWSVQTPATFTATSSGSEFTLMTSKGSCGVSGGLFQCGSSVTPSTFGSTTSGSNILLTFAGSSTFSADSIPSGTAQIPVFAGSSKAQVFSLVFNAV